MTDFDADYALASRIFTSIKEYRAYVACFAKMKPKLGDVLEMYASGRGYLTTSKTPQTIGCEVVGFGREDRGQKGGILIGRKNEGCGSLYGPEGMANLYWISGRGDIQVRVKRLVRKGSGD